MTVRCICSNVITGTPLDNPHVSMSSCNRRHCERYGLLKGLRYSSIRRVPKTLKSWDTPFLLEVVKFCGFFSTITKGIPRSEVHQILKKVNLDLVLQRNSFRSNDKMTGGNPNSIPLISVIDEHRNDLVT